MFADYTGGIDTTAADTYRIPAENIMQADMIFAERDYLLADTTTKHELINALGTQVNLLYGVMAASEAETRAVSMQRDAYKTDAAVQAKLAKKEHARADWLRIGWVASEIATIIIFIAL
jgi:hypothetical protein